MRTLFYSFTFTLCLIAIFVGIAAHQKTVVLADTNIAQAATSSSLSGITFPVAELGNCASRDACETYCDQTANIAACTAFAQAHGLVTIEEASKAHKFAQLLQSGGGPGGCTSPESCQAFCSNIQNISTCVSFAKDHGFSDDNVSHAEKIQQFVQGGGVLPGGCTSKDSCEEYCSDFTHATECQQFAQKAGITEIENLGQQKIPSGQFEKFLELVKEHKTPGQCTSAQACQAFCQDQSHADECLEFAKEAGFISSDQAEKIKNLGGKGPGGCDSEDSCKAFCNDPAHQTECLQFAKDHGLISPEEEHDTKDAFVRLREGIDNAPPAVQQCLASTLGQQTLQDIESGKLIPSPALGQQMRTCFENFKASEDPGEALHHLPSDVTACIKAKLGTTFDQIQQGKEEPTSDMADAIHACMQLKDTENEHGMQGIQQILQNMLESAPLPVRTCLQNQQQQIAQTTDPDKLKEIIHQCLDQVHTEQMAPTEQQQRDQMENPEDQSSGGQNMQNMQNEMKQMMPLQMPSGGSEQESPSSSGNAPAPQISPAPQEPHSGG